MASNVTIDQDIRKYIEDVLKEANQVDNNKRKRKNVEEDSRLKDFDLVDKLHQTKKRKMDDVYRRSHGPIQIKKVYQPKNKIQGPTRNDAPEYANFNYPCLMGPITFKYIGRTCEPILDFTYLLNKTREEKGSPKGIVESGEVSSEPLRGSSDPLEEAEENMDSPMIGCIAIDDEADPEEAEESELNRTDIFVNDEEDEMVIVIDD